MIELILKTPIHSKPEDAMRQSHYIMTHHDVYRYAAAVLQPQLGWNDRGEKCTAETLLQILFYAAAQLCSIAAACSRLRTSPSGQAVREALSGACAERQGVERSLNASVAQQLPKALRQRHQRLAIDLTLVPYHGQAHRREAEIYRSEAKSGTTHFHAYASCYVVKAGKRFTVGLIPVEHSTSMVTVLKHVLAIAARAGVRPSLLLLDRGFFSVEVIRYLHAARYPFIMPVIIRGRKASHAKGPGGTRVLALQKYSGWTRYTMTAAGKRTASFTVCIHCRNLHARQNKHCGRTTLVYACWGLTTRVTECVYQTYRQRFGIETSYRQLHQARITTTTRNPILRLLYVGIALYLRNVWVWVHYHCLATPRRGGRKINLGALRFKTLTYWIARVVESLFGVNDQVVAHNVP